jgi:hypothetical protein
MPSYGHPDWSLRQSDGVFWTFCPNAGEEDPNSTSFVKPLRQASSWSEEEQRAGGQGEGVGKPCRRWVRIQGDGILMAIIQLFLNQLVDQCKKCSATT